MIDFKIISIVSMGFPIMSDDKQAPCGSLQKLIMSRSNFLIEKLSLNRIWV